MRSYVFSLLSMIASEQAGQCARLMDTVFREFLPLVWEGGSP